MSRRTCTLVATAALLPGWGAAALGAEIWVRQFDPPQPILVTVEQYGGSFTVTSELLGLLRMWTSAPLYTATPCHVQAQVIAAEDGFDVIYQVSNHTMGSLMAPALVLPGIMLGDKVEYLDHTFGCTFSTLVAQPNGAINSPGLIYPAPLYSPVMVLRDSTMAVGVSLKYPVLQYRHAVKTFAARWPGATDWYVYLFLKGLLAPNESRTYVASVRFSSPDAWIHTLRPYQEYFWSLYGSQPRYVQDLRPVFGAGMSSESFFAPDNPRGFHQAWRPDRDGWQKAVDALLPIAQSLGYERMMIWTPSGLYGPPAFYNNFPPQFMSGWSPLQVQTAGEFQRLRAAGVQVCFWWGHSAFLADRWEDDAYEPFNPNNPAQRQVMLNEWSLAVQRGADGAGLDAFEPLKLWDALPWLATLLSVKPDAFLIAEAACADVMHLQVPFWIQGGHLPSPHLLADYLVPEREIWVHLAGTDMNMDRIDEVTSWGLTVNMIGTTISAHRIRRALSAQHVPPGPNH